MVENWKSDLARESYQTWIIGPGLGGPGLGGPGLARPGLSKGEAINQMIEKLPLESTPTLWDADGLRFLRELVHEDDSVRVIFFSRDPEAERECYKAGAVEYVRKPYSIAEVGRAVNRAMRPGVVS